MVAATSHGATRGGGEEGRLGFGRDGEGRELTTAAEWEICTAARGVGGWVAAEEVGRGVRVRDHMERGPLAGL